MREPPAAPSAAPAPPSRGASPGAAGSARAPEDAASCLAKLGASSVKAETVPAPPASLQDCGIAAPVRLSSITLASGASLDLVDRPILDCEFAGVFADYARNAMAPLAQSMLGSPIAALATGPGYECRGRNRVGGAKTSAHGKGIAIDLALIMLADRRRIEIVGQSEARETLFVHTMRKAACGWFTTVLGPGSDAAHANHLHFDILRHGASENYRICE
ncbi:MAG: extensin family protein [Hyphomicrobiales bacterium]